MNKILKELSVKDSVSKAKAYPTFKYYDEQSSMNRSQSVQDEI